MSSVFNFCGSGERQDHLSALACGIPLWVLERLVFPITLRTDV